MTKVRAIALDPALSLSAQPQVIALVFGLSIILVNVVSLLIGGVVRPLMTEW